MLQVQAQLLIWWCSCLNRFEKIGICWESFAGNKCFKSLSERNYLYPQLSLVCGSLEMQLDQHPSSVWSANGSALLHLAESEQTAFCMPSPLRSQECHIEIKTSDTVPFEAPYAVILRCFHPSTFRPSYVNSTAHSVFSHSFPIGCFFLEGNFVSQAEESLSGAEPLCAGCVFAA